jgi:hypothetical protein
MRSDHHHLDLMPTLLELDHQLQAVHAGHFQVGDDAIVVFLLKHLQRLGGAAAAVNAVAGLPQHVAHRLAGLRVIVDHQHAAAAFAGRDVAVGNGVHAAASRAAA